MFKMKKSATRIQDRGGWGQSDWRSKTLPLMREGRSNKVYPYIATLKCLSIGTTKIINFPFVSNGKFMVFMCPNIHAHYNEAVLCLNFGTPENNKFSIWNKWKIYYF